MSGGEVANSYSSVVSFSLFALFPNNLFGVSLLAYISTDICPCVYLEISWREPKGLVHHVR